MCKTKSRSIGRERRPGPGRPTVDHAEGLQRINVLLADEHIDKAVKLGAGNLSLGIRRALDHAAKSD
jgi:hypothetical protein